MSKKKKSDIANSASSACATVASNCDLNVTLNYLGPATAADGTITNVISTSNGITAQEAYDTLTCTSLSTSAVVTTDLTNGTYYYPWERAVNELTINTTPNVLSWPVTGITINSGEISFDLSGIDWTECFRLRSNRRHLNLKFCL